MGMGSNLNFKNFGNEPPAGGGDAGRPPGNSPLTRQSSVYSLTFEEFQNTIGGSGKDFGSMNMDELLKSIWSAEDIQNFGSTSGVGGVVAGGGGGGGGDQEAGGLQRQGSLILPRTLSQKTVDEVWRNMSKEANGVKDVSGGIPAFGVPQRQATLGEITLEEFLVRAGVVREETQLASNSNNAGYFGDLWHPVNSGNSAIGFGFQQQQQQQQHASRNVGLIGGVAGVHHENSNQIGVKSTATLPLNVNGVRSAAQQLENQQQQQQQLQQQQQQQQQRQHQQILPKQSALAYGSPLGIQTNGQLGSPRVRGGMMGVSDPSTIQNPGLQGGALGMVGLASNGSPAVSSDGLSKSNGDTPSVSPVPYVFNGGLRGRKSAALEKVVERRQRRMIKNRESAARSRARKQAYTMELEAEVQKLKEENEHLQKKQEEIMEMQKNQVLEMMKQQNGSKRHCLRRTQTGPW